MADKTLLDYPTTAEPDEAEDNVRVYIPLDLSKEAILRRLDQVIYRFGEATEENEFAYSAEVGMLINQIEIYDQIWYVRHMPEEGKHSIEAVELVKEFVSKLKEIPDGCAECFPFDEIEDLTREYFT